jgi:coproporphyrinogen III oxidase-like Fe-S oxidoreductase
MLGEGVLQFLQKGKLAILEYCRDSFNMSSDCSTKFAACINNLSEEKIQFSASNKVDQLDIGTQTFDEEFRRILPSSRQQQNAKLKLRREL